MAHIQDKASTSPGEKFDLAEQALRASGVVGEGRLRCYGAILGRLLQLLDLPPSLDEAVARAEYLFRWLWQGRPHRYQPGGSFRLHEVLEAQFHPGPQEVGNCLGLTLLYNCLAQRLGLRVGAVYLESGFQEASHVFSLLYIPQGTVDIENILPQGFGYPGHQQQPGRVEWGDRELVADIYLSRGNELFLQERWGEAAEMYEKALELNPAYEKASLNVVQARAQLAA